jgi:hypothetical protein
MSEVQVALATRESRGQGPPAVGGVRIRVR